MPGDDPMSSILSVLSAMITPAVLISACGSLTISTSNRLARAIERTRKLSDDIRTKAIEDDAGASRELLVFLFDQLQHSVKRTRLLHRALSATYVALAVFVATSIVIGVEYLLGSTARALPTSLSMIGVALLLYASLLLSAETRHARRAIEAELALILRQSRGRVPDDVLRDAVSELKPEPPDSA